MRANLFMRADNNQDAWLINTLVRGDVSRSASLNVLNHLVKRAAEEENYNLVAIYLVDYTDYIGKRIHFKKVLDKEVYEMLMRKICFNYNEDDYLIYGYFNGEGFSYLTTSIKRIRQTEKDDLEINSYHQKPAGGINYHCAIVKSDVIPDPYMISIQCGNEPNTTHYRNGYVIDLHDGTFEVKWESDIII